MTDDLGCRIAALEDAEEVQEGFLLGCRKGVLGSTLGVGSANKTDANAICVVALGVGSRHMFRSSDLHRPVESDDVVVADHSPPAFTVPTVDVSYVMLSPLRCCRIMDDQLGNWSTHLAILLG